MVCICCWPVSPELPRGTLSVSREGCCVTMMGWRSAASTMLQPATSPVLSGRQAASSRAGTAASAAIRSAADFRLGSAPLADVAFMETVSDDYSTMKPTSFRLPAGSTISRR